MNLLSRLMVSILIFGLLGFIFSLFKKRKFGSTPTVFWIVLLFGAEVFTLFPPLVDWISLLWGNLWPVSWITFIGFIILILNILILASELNRSHLRIVETVRHQTFLEKRISDLEKKLSG